MVNIWLPNVLDFYKGSNTLPTSKSDINDILSSDGIKAEARNNSALYHPCAG